MPKLEQSRHLWCLDANLVHCHLSIPMTQYTKETWQAFGIAPALGSLIHVPLWLSEPQEIAVKEK